MKNFISYYYNFYVSEIHLYQGRYFFSYEGIHYLFKPCDELTNIIENIYELNRQLIKMNPYYHQIVQNRDHSLITIVENHPYVMLKLSNIPNELISIFDIKGKDYIQLDKEISILNRFEWTVLWENKIDYFEQQIFAKKNKYDSILNSFHYFIGMAENAILYVNEALATFPKEATDQLVVSHRRFHDHFTLIDFYDPTNLIIDHKSRDVAEFLKYSFLSKNYDMRVIRDFLEQFELSNLGAQLLFGRLLFPSFYFDYLEELLVDGKYDSIYQMESRIEEYTLFITDIFEILKSKYRIQEISWIIKS